MSLKGFPGNLSLHCRAMLYMLYIIVAVTLYACEKEYTARPDQSATFIKFFGGFNTDKAYAAEQVADGGFVCIGTTNSAGEGGNDIYLVKTDASGNRLWHKTFGGQRNDEGRAVQVLPDGGLVVLGHFTNEQGYKDLFLIKTDKDGNKEWDQYFGDATLNEEAYALKLLADGSFLLIGNITRPTGLRDMYIIKTTSTGSKLWEKSYGLTGLNDEIGSVQETHEGNLIWCGAEYREKEGNIAGKSNMRVVLTRPEGNLLWDKNYGKENSETGADIQLTDAGFIVVGTMHNTQQDNDDVYVVSLFHDGTLRWYKTYGGPRNDSGQSIYPASDGGYVIAGTTESAGEGGRDIYLLKINQRGEEQWSKTFGGKLDDTGSMVRQTVDGGYMLFGTITFENNNMLCLIKTNAKGELVNK